MIQGGIGCKFSNKNPFATANTKISKWKCIPRGPFISTFILISSLFSIISHDANSSLHYAPQTNISIAYTSYPYPIIILLFISLSYHPSYHPIIPILILLFPSLSYFITWSHFLILNLVTTMALQINCSTFHSFLFGPQQERVEQLISNEQSWPICYLRPLTLWGLQDIPKTHNQSNFRTDTPSGSKWKTLFCSFSEGGRVTEIQFVKSPFAQNEKFKLIWPQEAFYFVLLSSIVWLNN